MTKMAPYPKLTHEVGDGFLRTDEGLVQHYLIPKIRGYDHQVSQIPTLDLFKILPWDIPQYSTTTSNTSEFFFFCPRYGRANRATEKGRWNTNGYDCKIRCEVTKKEIGTKKYLTYYYKTGSSRKESKTNWFMHEYSATFNPPIQSCFVLCKLFEKRVGMANILTNESVSSTYSDFESPSPYQNTVYSSETSPVLSSAPNYDIAVGGVTEEVELPPLPESLEGFNVQDSGHSILQSGTYAVQGPFYCNSSADMQMYPSSYYGYQGACWYD